MPKIHFSNILSAVSAGVTLCACSPINVINALTPGTTYRSVTDVAYGDLGRQRLDVYVPTRAGVADAGMPVVVFFYGGSWQGGDRAEYRFVGEALASQGFLAILPDYRTFPEVTFPAFMEDAAGAVRWGADHAGDFGGDPGRLFLMGHSAGAQIVTLLATDERYLLGVSLSTCAVSGVVGLAGPYDFLPLQSATLRWVFPVLVREASQPIRFVTGREPPMFLGVGDTDLIVEPGNTDRFAQRLQETGVRVDIRHYDLGHALMLGAISTPLRRFFPVLSDIANFVDGEPQRATRVACAQGTAGEISPIQPMP
ncbi:carboxylesterase [Pandoraea oxalativorans]|uniref:Carboxylesterase n=2 Tax=Pandoraea oxalativorans TaxID=573737 RepID=A0A0E3YDP1_9BURK|nr:carboxylesterase [Pandoraea oxalativorans]